MTNYTIASGDWGVHNVTFTSNTENVVLFGSTAYRFEIVVHSATQPIFYKYVDVASAVTVNDPDSAVLFAAPNSVSVAESQGVSRIRMITAGTATVSVMRA